MSQTPSPGKLVLSRQQNQWIPFASRGGNLGTPSYLDGDSGVKCLVPLACCPPQENKRSTPKDETGENEHHRRPQTDSVADLFPAIPL